MATAKETMHENEETDVIEVDETDPVEETDAEPPNNLRRLPLHSVADKDGNIKVRRGRGRPKTVSRKPDISDLDYHAEMSEEKKRFIENDPVVIAATKPHSEALTMLKVIRSEIAREQAALAFQRVENEKLGKDTAQVSSRRVSALSEIARIELEMKKIGTDVIDFGGEKFQKVFAMWIETLREAAQEVLPPEHIEIFFNRFSTMMEGWEERATSLTR